MDGLLSCPTCGLIQREPGGATAAGALWRCFRCRARLHREDGPAWRNRAAVTLAVSALVLFPAAVLLPFLEIETLGHRHRSSLLGGAVSLVFSPHWLIGLVIVLFSVIFPVAKLLLIILLCLPGSWLAAPWRRQVFRLVEWMGRWGMLDVLLVAVLIAYVKLSGMVEFAAGPGVAAFTAVVTLSLLASGLFDPHGLWSESMTAATDPDRPEAVPPSPENLTTPTPPSEPPPRPTAVVARRSRLVHLWWLAPLAAVAVVAGLVWTQVREQGPLLTLRFDQGHGLKVGNELRHLGVPAGHVEAVRLVPDGSGIVVEVRLNRSADYLARRSSRFWIVRPELGLTKTDGLDTIIGEKYLAVRPGPEGDPRETEFVGLPAAPLVDLDFPGGVEVILNAFEATAASGLKVGVPVFYRSLRVGAVTRVGLSADAGAVEARVYVRPDYKHLIRPGTRFWTLSGIRFDGGLSGMKAYLAPAESWVGGGIELATPDGSGPPVESGHRFTLHPTFEKEWLEWKPALATASPPPPVRAAPVSASWVEDGYAWDSKRSAQGWGLLAGDQLIVLNGLLGPPPKQAAHDVRVQVAGRDLPAADRQADAPFTAVPLPEDLRAAVTGGGRIASPRFRAWIAADDVAIVTDPDASAVVVIAAARFTLTKEQAGGVWRIDPTLPITAAHRGGALVATRDGAVVGFLDLDKQGPYVVPVPANWSLPAP